MQNQLHKLEYYSTYLDKWQKMRFLHLMRWMCFTNSVREILGDLIAWWNEPVARPTTNARMASESINSRQIVEAAKLK